MRHPKDSITPNARVGRLRLLAGTVAVLGWVVGCASLGSDPVDPAPRASSASRSSGVPGTTGSSASGVAEGEPAEEPARAPSPGEPLPSLGPGPAPDEAGVPVHGSLLLRYRGRRTDGASDHDAYATLSMDIGDPERHAFTGHFMGRVWADLGGDDPDHVFSGLDDTFGHAVSGILYYAYVDAEQIDALEILRIGRQQIWETPAFLVFDGVRAESREDHGLSFGAYGGLRSQYYDHPTPTDVVAGIYGRAKPWEGGRLRLDYMYLEDEERLGSGEDDLFGLNLRQLLWEELTLEGNYTVLEGESRDVRLRAQYLDPDSELSLEATYYELLQTQKQQALETDPYYSSLTEYRPFRQVGLLASKAVGAGVVVSLGLDSRKLDDDDVGEFNHEFERYYVSTAFEDLLLDGLELTLTGDVWDDDQQDVQTWGLDLTRQFTSMFQGSLGSYYSLYKYDLLQESERDDVRTYYGRLQYDRTEALSFDLQFEYEDDDYEQYQKLVLGSRWLF